MRAKAQMPWWILAACLSCGNLNACSSISPNFCREDQECGACAQCLDGTCVPAGLTCGDNQNGDSHSAGDGPAPADPGASGDTIKQGDSTPSGDDAPIQGVVWRELELPIDTQEIRAIWGRSDTEIFVGVGAHGKVLKLVDGRWQVWTQLRAEIPNSGINSLWGTANQLFVGTDSPSPVLIATDGVAFNFIAIDDGGSEGYPDSIADIHGLDDNEVYAVVAHYPGGSSLHRLGEETTTSLLSSPADAIRNLESVWVVAPDQLYLGGWGEISFYDHGSVIQEAIDWPDDWLPNEILGVFIADIVGVDDELYAVASHHFVFRRDDNLWTRVYGPDSPASSNSGGDLRAVAGCGNPTGQIAAVGSESLTGVTVALDRGNGWVDVSPSQRLDGMAIFSVEPGRFLVGGAVRGSFDGLLLEATIP